MARLEDKIAEIPNAKLRKIIDEEVKALKKKKQFGLVFEPHSPEVVLRHRAPVKRDATVAKKGGKFAETWQVVRVHGEDAEILRTDSDGKPQRETVPVDSLIVVHRMAEPIYPALVPIASVQNGDPAQPHHILIEADNYHALQLLTYAYAGKVDCIYIDPPYNSGARDWKYNNDYVDANDSCRHSKWLAMMERRLLLAKQLLNPVDSVLIVSIDEKEYLRLGLLLEQIFPDARLQMVSSLINPKGQSRNDSFARTDEYLFFACFGNSRPSRLPLGDDWRTGKTTVSEDVYWQQLRRRGLRGNVRREDRPGLFYPLFVKLDGTGIHSVGEPIPLEGEPSIMAPQGTVAVWPTRSDGSYGYWQVGPDRLRELITKGMVRASKTEVGSIYYLKQGEVSKVETGQYRIVSRRNDGSIVTEPIEGGSTFIPGTQWRIASHNAGEYGTNILSAVLPTRHFPFPKSIYAVEDALRFFVANKPESIIVDFFAGSGTTLNAVNLLNAIDGGHRQCILVTNNEVSEEEAGHMAAQGLQPGDAEWDAVGICRSVTWPRNKFTILGKRDDGTVLEGEYQTGRSVSKDKARNIRQLGFAEGRTLSLPQRKQLAALMPDLPQSKLEANTSWFLDAELQPAMIIQVENGPPAQFLALAISTLENEVGPIRDEELAHAFQEDTEIKAGHHRIRKIDASCIQDEAAVKFVFFKMALTTGWDCPRAEVMMSFRKANDHTLIAQLIGRMIRTPLARRVEEHEVLNTVALYLPHFDKVGVQSVVDRLKSDPDTVPPTDVEADGNSLVTLTRRTDTAADAFKALRTVPTYRVERVRKQSNTRRLMKLSRLLTSLHAVDMDALDDTKALIVGTLKSEMDRLRKEDPAFDSRLSGCDEITVNAVTIEQGTWKDLGGKPERVPLNTNNVDDLFHRAGLRLGEGLEMEYWQTHGDLEDPQRAKLEVFYITQDARAWDTLEKVCGERINALFLKNKSAIAALTSAEREQYNNVRELAKEPEALEFSAPAEIVVAIGKEGFAAYDKHLFLDPEGAYRADLNTWERATIEAEIAHTDVVGWLRNYDRKPWALSLPYDDGANVLPMFPDFLVVRREGAAMAVDILEPHRPDLDDNWKKARGLAKYAKKHYMELGGIELIRVKGGQLQRLNFALPAVHEKALQWITSNGHLDELFDEMATT